MEETLTRDAQTPARARPRGPRDPIGWARANLFDGWFNSLLTILILGLLVWIVPPLVRWAITDAVFGAATPDEGWSDRAMVWHGTANRPGCDRLRASP